MAYIVRITLKPEKYADELRTRRQSGATLAQHIQGLVEVAETAKS